MTTRTLSAQTICPQRSVHETTPLDPTLPPTTRPHPITNRTLALTPAHTTRAPTIPSTIAHRHHTKSHDDPGWVRTADQYFDHFVKHMYTTVVSSLASHPHRRFQAVEMVYLKQWYAREGGEKGRDRGEEVEGRKRESARERREYS